MKAVAVLARLQLPFTTLLADTATRVISKGMITLTLLYQPEDEWHGELTATVQSGEFSGRGAAWFGIEQIERFCEQLKSFPISADEPPILRGGFFEDKGERLEQCHLGITFTPYDKLGQIRVTVELATPVWKNDESGLDHSLMIQLLVCYADVSSFQASLEGMLNGAHENAQLKATPT